jgi:hypothetical protein
LRSLDLSYNSSTSLQYDLFIFSQTKLLCTFFPFTDKFPISWKVYHQEDFSPSIFKSGWEEEDSSIYLEVDSAFEEDLLIFCRTAEHEEEIVRHVESFCLKKMFSYAKQLGLIFYFASQRQNLFLFLCGGVKRVLRQNFRKKNTFCVLGMKKSFELKIIW